MMNIAEIKVELDSCKKGQKRAILERYANLYGVSAATIYRAIRREYGPAKKIKREKKVDQKVIDEIARMKLRGLKTGANERELSTELCVERLKNLGWQIGASISTINRRLAESGFRQRDVITRVEAEYANQMHQLDFSRSEYFQLWKFDERKNDFILKIQKNLRYKDDNTKLSTWLVGIIDAYSRVGLAKMYAASGESAAIGIDFLNYCYTREEDEIPFRYLPDILKTDNGAFIKNKNVKAMLDALSIKSELVKPYEKRGIQKVESLWKRIWRRFELKLVMDLGDGGTMHMEDYNDLLHEFMITTMQADHPVKAGSREHVYRSSIGFRQQRELKAADLREIGFIVMTRTVRDDLTVSIDNEKYEAPLFTLGKKIRIFKNMNGELVGELIEQKHDPFILKPTEGHVKVGDFSHREHQTYKQKISNEAEKQNKEERIQNTEKGKILKYAVPRKDEFEPETKFTEAKRDMNAPFEDFSSAKRYVASKLLGGDTYTDYEEMFDDFIAKNLGKLKPSDIDQVIDVIYNRNVSSG